jgi:hypothetical protein
MPTSTKQSAEEIRSTLGQFHGLAEFYRRWTGRIQHTEGILNRLGLRRGELRPVSHRAVEQDRERLRVEVPQPRVIPLSKLGPERIRHRFLRRVATGREEPDPNRLAHPAPDCEVVVIEERGIVERAPGSG